MALLLKIITPENVVFSGEVTSVAIPTFCGEIEILENHLPILGILEPGAITYKVSNNATTIATDAGFFQLANNVLSILTEAAVDVKILDNKSIEEAIKRAEEELQKAKAQKSIDAEELERLDKYFKFQVAQKLVKQKNKGSGS